MSGVVGFMQGHSSSAATVEQVAGALNTEQEAVSLLLRGAPCGFLGLGMFQVTELACVNGRSTVPFQMAHLGMSTGPCPIRPTLNFPVESKASCSTHTCQRQHRSPLS